MMISPRESDAAVDKNAQDCASKILLTATTRWPSAARLMIELSRLGHRVSIVCPTHGHPARKVRASHAAFPYKPLRPLDSLVEAIAATKPDLIVPCDDLAVRHLHQLHARPCAQSASGLDIPATIVRSLGPAESYSAVSSRDLLLKIAREEGIRAPETRLIETQGDLHRWCSTQPSPWVLKADGTTGGVGVRIARTRREADAFFVELRRPMSLLRCVKHLTVDRDLILEAQPFWRRTRRVQTAVVAQSFISGGAANCAVVCWEGEVLAGLACEAVSTDGPVGPATVIRLVDNDEMMSAAAKIARRLRLSGFFGLDFVIEEGTRAPYLIELNPRCTPPSHLRLGPGRDLVGALTARLGGRPSFEPEAVTQNEMIAYFPQAMLKNSEFLSSSYHDVPDSEPDLVTEMSRPSPRPKRLIRPQFFSSRVA